MGVAYSLAMKLVAITLTLFGAYATAQRTLRQNAADLAKIPKAWKSGLSPNFSPDKKAADYAYLLGAWAIPEHLDLPEDTRPRALKDHEIPSEYDPRDAYGDMCPSLNQIRDQGSCGSCWAFGAAEALSDRACIQSNGAITADLSAQDILTCCKGLAQCGLGCNGGNIAQAWRYLENTGICTGGLYEGTGCRPYTIAPCVHHSNDTSRPNCADLPNSRTPACTQECQASYTTNAYANDIIKVSESYRVPRSVADIQEEIMTYGPVEAGFNVYEDFMNYVGGVYYHVSGRMEGGHAVKVMGWGFDEEAGMDYWLVANSWNTDWGEKGFFRIRMGTDECGIEHGMYAGNL